MSLQSTIHLKFLGNNASPAIVFPLSSSNEDITAFTGGTRMGWWADRSGGTEGITTVILGTNVFKVLQTGATILGNTVWHAGNLNPSIYQLAAAKGVASGYAGLDGSALVPFAQLPTALSTAFSFQGSWNATTNSPALTSSVGTAGYAYVVTTAGISVLDGLSDWLVGDIATFDGAVWRRIAGVRDYTMTGQATLISGSAVVVDSVTPPGLAMYTWDLIVTDLTTGIQAYTVMAAFDGSTVYSPAQVTAGNLSGSITAVSIGVSGGAVQLSVTASAAGLYATATRRGLN